MMRQVIKKFLTKKGRNIFSVSVTLVHVKKQMNADALDHATSLSHKLFELAYHSICIYFVFLTHFKFSLPDNRTSILLAWCQCYNTALVEVHWNWYLYQVLLGAMPGRRCESCLGLGLDQTRNFKFRPQTFKWVSLSSHRRHILINSSSSRSSSNFHGSSTRTIKSNFGWLCQGGLTLLAS